MISILLPIYNGKEFLIDSIPSVINQTYSDWELLIGINGHSFEEWLPIVNSILLFNDQRINFFFMKEKSKIKTLNKLVKYSSAEKYICLLDVDDKWETTKLEKQLLIVGNYDVVGSNAQYFGERSGHPEIFLGKLSSKMFTYQNPIINSSVMIKKEDAWWDESWEGLDDYNLWVYLLNKQKIFYNHPEVLAYHRVHSGSYYHSSNEELRLKLINNLQKLSEQDYQELGMIMEQKKWEL